MADQILVSFEGEGSGVGELSWGQQVIWSAMRDQGSSLHMGQVRPLAAGSTVEDVADELRFIMSRHQSLRTRLRFAADATVLQVVSSSGQVPLDVVEAGDAAPAGVAAVLAARYQETNFDYAGEWPVRMGVVTQRGVATHVAETFCHLAGDGFGMAALRADLAARAAGSGQAMTPVTAWQPLEQARRQHLPAARRASDAAIRYWQRLLRDLPDGMFRDRPATGAPRSLHAVYTSHAAHLAVRLLAARTRTSTSSVLLAMFAVALARVTGSNPAVMQVVVSNRFRPGLADTVSPVNQSCLCVIDVAGCTFDEVVARAWRSAIGAYKHAYYDPRQLEQLLAAMASERGGLINLSCFINDRRLLDRQEPAGPIGALAEEDLRAALRHSTLERGGQTDGPCERLFLYINDAADAMCCELWADTRYMSAADLEATLRALEDVAVEAAACRVPPGGAGRPAR
jgi:hypothetical protein